MIDDAVEDRAEALQAAPGRAFDGPYRLEDQIGTGTTGIVYRAAHEKLDKPVAIKVLHERLGEDAPGREQFNREAKALTALEHSNIVTVSDFGIAGDAPYLVMDLLEGTTLEERLKSGAIDQSDAEGFMQALLRALAYMHMRGVVHGNLKPANVFLQRDGDSDKLKLLDFGVPKLAANSNAGEAAFAQTRIGRPPSPYTSPEEAVGEDADARSDVYAAGVMMMHMLAGRAPQADETSEPHVSIMPTNVSPMVELASPELDNFIARALAEDRRERFGNADQMLKALLELPSPWFSQADVTPDDDSDAAPVPADAEIELDPETEAIEEDAPEEAGPIAHFESAPPEEDAEEGDLALSVESSTPPLPKRRIPRAVKLGIGGALLLLGLGGGFLAWRSKQAEHPAEQPKEGEHAAAEKPGAEKTKAGKAKGKAGAAKHGADEHKAGHAEGKPTAADGPGAHEGAKAEGHEAHGGDDEHGKGEAHPDEHASPEAAEAPGHDDKQDKHEPQAEHAAGDKHAAEAEHAEETKAEAKHGAEDKIEDKHAEAKTEDKHAAETKPEAKPSAEDKHAAETKAEAKHGAEDKTAEAKTDDKHAAETKPSEHEADKAAAKTEAPKEPPPDPSTERHIQPSDDELRDMLVIAHAPAKKRTPAKDPWSEQLPRELQALRESIRGGARGSQRKIEALRSYNHDNPNDVLGHLLLAGMYFNRGWALDSLDEYDLAFQIDPSARGAPEMLNNALEMVVRDKATADAERFIDRTYKKEALPAIERALRVQSVDPRATQRLNKLKARVNGRVR